MLNRKKTKKRFRMLALLVLSLATLCTCANYTDEFARKVMFPIAAAAYSDHAWMCLANNFLGAKVKNERVT